MGSARKNPRGKPLPQLRSRTTRSSKGRLLTSSDPAASTALLTTQLRALGLYPADTVGDGNCLFRALSDQLYGSPSRHMELRGQICDWIQKHRDRYEPFVEDERGLETHLQCMRENATYGGHMELSAFSHLARRNVKVIQPGLVYVIEWAAFASPTSSPAKASMYNYEYDDEDDDGGSVEEDSADEEDAQLDDRERRRLRRERVRGVKEKKGKKDKGKKDKAAPHKRTPSLPEPTTTTHNTDSEGDTIYVAYHDWEHFSSIRNLRGPHTGLPVVRETPPPPPVAVPPASPGKGKKPPLAEKEKRKKKVTLKLAPAPAEVEVELDPAAIPLPTSRAASPFPTPAPSTSGSGSADASPAPHPLRTSHVPDSTPAPPEGPLSHPHPPTQIHLYLHRTTQSPKRALDTTGDDSECSAASSGSSSKRSRTSRSHSSHSHSHSCSCSHPIPPPAHAMDVDVDRDSADTPSLSPPSSASASSTTSSSSVPSPPSPPSSSADASPSPSPASSPEPEPEPDNLNHKHALPVMQQQHPPQRERPLTRRQLKALGLPKYGRGAGAGRIVIPGGRFRKGGKGGGVGVGVGVGVGAGDGEELGGEGGEGKEWVRNGTGRVDVRGFRELKI